MGRLTSHILDALFPYYCVGCERQGEVLCTSCARYLRPMLPECFYCRRLANKWMVHEHCSQAHGPDQVVVLWGYNGLAKALLKQLKYQGITSIGERLAQLAITRLSTLNVGSLIERGVIVPVPSHRFRYNRRGFNPTQLIGSKIASSFALPYLPTLLLRKRDRASQTSFTHQMRASMANDTFELSTDQLQINQKFLADRNILIFDDVVTTGSTLRLITETIRKEPSFTGSINALALFRGRPYYNSITPNFD